jgi:phage terminase small subunit
LSPEAAKVWQRARKERPEADGEQLALYASAVTDAAKAQDLINRSGPVVQGAKGLVRNPLQSVKSANVAAARALAKDLGLAAPPKAKGRTRNQRAMEGTISALRGLGRLEPVDEATLALCRSLATAMDALDPDDPSIASLARTQLQALRLLRGQADDDANTLAALLLGVRSTVGDAPES